MKETVIDFKKTVPIKETEIDFKKTVKVQDKKQPQQVPWYQTTWNNVKSFSKGLTTNFWDATKQTGGNLLRYYGEAAFQPDSPGATLWNPGSSMLYHVLKEKGIIKPEVFQIKPLTKTGEKLTNTAAQSIQTRKQKAGIKPGSSEEFSFDLGSSASQMIPGLALTAATKNPTFMVVSNGVSSAANTYSGARDAGANEEMSALSALGAGYIDVFTGNIEVKWLLTPGKNIFTHTLRQSLGNATIDTAAEVFKIGIDKGTIKPNMTWSEATERLKATGLSSGILGSLQAASTYPFIKAPRYKANLAAEAAKATLEAEGKVVNQPLLEDPKGLSEAEVQEVLSGTKSMDEVQTELETVNIKPREKTTKEIPVFKKVSPEEFIEQRSKSKRPEFLTPYTKEKMQDWELYMTGDGVGYALTPEKDLVNVFNNSGVSGAGEFAVIDGISKGAKTLDAFAGKLDSYYNDFGFTETNRVQWEDQFSPEGWNYDTNGRPDVVYMSYPESLSRESGTVAERTLLARAERVARNSGKSGPLPDLSLHRQYQGFDWSLWGELDSGTPKPSNGPDGVSSKPLKPELTEFYNNTLQRTTMVTYEAMSELIPEGFIKDTTAPSEAQSQAVKNLTESKPEAFERFSQSETFNNNTEVFEAVLMGMDLQKEAQASGDYTKYRSFMEKYDDKISNTGSVLKSHDLAWDKVGTAEGAVLTAIHEINKAKRFIKENKLKIKNPELTDDDIAQIINTMEKVQGFPEKSYPRKSAAEQVRKLIRQKLNPLAKHKAANVLLHATNNNLVSSVSTFIANITGNTFRKGYVLLKAYGYGVFDYSVHKGDTKALKEAFARTQGELESIQQMFTHKPILGEASDPSQVAASGDTLVGPNQVQGKTFTEKFADWFDELHEKANAFNEYVQTHGVDAESTMASEGRGFVPNALHSDYLKDPEAPMTNAWKLLDILGTVQNLPYDMNVLADNPYKVISLWGEGRAEVFRQAEKTGLIGQDKIDFTAKLWQDFQDYALGLRDPDTPEQLKLIREIYDKGLEVAKENTFQGKLGKRTEALGRILNETPLVKLLFARFYKTPLNVFKTTLWDDAPLLKLLTKKNREDVLGINGQEAQTKAIVSHIMGSLLWSGLWGIVASHKVTGSHPKEDRDRLLAENIPENSIDLSGKGDWWNYRRHDILALPLSIIATVHTNYDKLKDAEAKEFSSAMIMALGNSVMASSMLRSLGDIYRATQGYESGTKNILESQYAKGLATSLVPFSGFTRSIERGDAMIGKDPYLREVETMAEQLTSIYASKNLRQKLNPISGEPLENEGSVLAGTIAHTDLSSLGMTRIWQLGMNIEAPPDTKFGVKMTPEQHWEYQRYIAEKFNLKALLDNLVSSEGFNQSSRGAQKGAIKGLIDGIRDAAAYQYFAENDLIKKIPEAKKEEVQEFLQVGPEPVAEDTVDWFKKY